MNDDILKSFVDRKRCVLFANQNSVFDTIKLIDMPCLHCNKLDICLFPNESSHSEVLCAYCEKRLIVKKEDDGYWVYKNE